MQYKLVENASSGIFCSNDIRLSPFKQRRYVANPCVYSLNDLQYLICAASVLLLSYLR